MNHKELHKFLVEAFEKGRFKKSAHYRDEAMFTEWLRQKICKDNNIFCPDPKNMEYFKGTK